MSTVRWDFDKNEWLKKERGVSFEELLKTKPIGKQRHPRKAHQSYMLFNFKNYIWVVPYVVKFDGIFLKTLYPSRKYTKIYLKGGQS